jgi:DNA-binding Lrp family transcriptional regulator
MYEYSQNSRIKTKELGKRLKISQQSASYLIHSLKKKKKIIVDHTTIIDPSKLGFISILVYYNFADFTATPEIISFLRQSDDVVSLEHLEQGYDLAAIFCVPNLSYFNKAHRDILQTFRGRVVVADIFPLVVKHLYPKNYLVPRKPPSEFVICGDRDVMQFSENERKVLGFLYAHPTGKIVEMAKKLNLNPKTIINVKNKLEKNEVIRGYSAVWNYQKLGISRRFILFNSEILTLKDDRRLLEFCYVHPYITSMTRLIGRYDIIVKVEGENLSGKDILRELRLEFGIKDYQVIPGGTILKERYVPGTAIS